jgi:hypothetical protein
MPSPLIVPLRVSVLRPLLLGKVTVPVRENEPSALGVVDWVRVRLPVPLMLGEALSVRVPV